MPNERILIVDDNQSNLKLARLLLEKAGYEVRVAGDSAEVLETLQSFSPRLILMDIQLPGMDGLTLTRRLRADGIARDSIIVAVTAYAMNGDQERAKIAGCDGYISKPINTRIFVDQVRNYLKESPEEPNEVQTDADPNDLLRELRNGFIAEGTELSRKYAALDPSGDEADAMRRVVHHWAGMGGTLGFPEITAAARELEALMETQPIRWVQRASQIFAEINSFFARSLGIGEPTVVPSGLAQDLASKQIGLIGFSESESIRVRSAFNDVSAVARDLGALSTGLGMDALRTHDLIVLNACTEEGIRSWDSVCAQPLLERPVLVIASRSALLDSKLALLERAVDFVLEPWDSEELICRAQKVIRHKASLPQQQTQPRSKPSVILADDDPIIHSLLIPMFNKMGIDSYSARDGQEALDTVSHLSPDLLILDISMPKIGGMSVLREIRKVQQNRDVRILMLSARQQRTDISMALASGADDYVIKPFDPEDLILRITRLLPQQTSLTADKG
jgi:two-component system cell cycle response regulator DivK